MSAKFKLILAAALAGVSIPAEAQYYPPPNYPQPNYPPQQYYPPTTPGGIVGAILNPYRYGQYPYGNYGYNQYGNERFGVDRCARAVEQRLGGNYNYNPYQGYNNSRYRQFGRVEGITRVQQKSYGLKVTGVASSGYGGYEGYNRRGYGTYGYSAGADLRFECKVYRNGQIRDIDIKRRVATWQGY